MTDKDLDEFHAIASKSLQPLVEHFDTVQILCSTSNEGETYRIEVGTGNIFARIYQAKAWAKRQATIEEDGALGGFYSKLDEEAEEGGE